MTDLPPAGRELDLLVSRRVFGKDCVSPPNYSTDMTEAWKVVERLRELHKAWTAKLDDAFPEAVRRFQEMPEEKISSYGNDVETIAEEMAGPKPFDFEVFFNRIHRAVDRRWPYSFLYVTPEIVCRAAAASFPPSPSEAPESVAQRAPRVDEHG